MEGLDAEQFYRLPLGQRKLVLVKVEDIVGSDDEGLKSSGARFLELLVVLGLHLPKEEYQGIVDPAFFGACIMASRVIHPSKML